VDKAEKWYFSGSKHSGLCPGTSISFHFTQVVIIQNTTLNCAVILFNSILQEFSVLNLCTRDQQDQVYW